MRRLTILLLLLPFTLSADRIVLKDGKEYRGTFVDAGDGQVKFRAGSRLRTFRAADIVRLEISGKPAPERPAPMRASTPLAAGPAESAPPARPEPAPPPLVTAPQIATTPINPIDGAAAIDSEYTRTGAETGPLGPALGPHQRTSDGRASVRVYSSGSIYWTKEGGAHALSGPMLQSWMAQGGERSRLGYPTSDEKVSNAGSTREQEYEGGRITWTEKSGAAVEYRTH